MTLENGQVVIALDFDGVLHDYHGWNEGKLAGPIPGIRRLVELLTIKHRCHVIVHITRDRDTVQGWLEEHGFPVLDVINEKWSRIDVFVDDRAVRFSPVLVLSREDQNAFASYLATYKPHWRHS